MDEVPCNGTTGIFERSHSPLVAKLRERISLCLKKTYVANHGHMGDGQTEYDVAHVPVALRPKATFACAAISVVPG